MKSLYVILLFLCLLFISPALFAQRIDYFTYVVKKSYPHDTSAFTQGLVFENGFFYEGTGLYGHSSLRKFGLEKEKLLNIVSLPFHLFGEGIAIRGESIFQLTWKAGTLIQYDKKNFKEMKRFSYSGEGWGLTFDGTHLIFSSGTDRLDFMTPDTFKPVRSIRVNQNGVPIKYLNELEYINGEIFANIWGSDAIVKIHPKTGRVTGVIDLSGLYPEKKRKHPQDVLNGIAYDQKNDRLYVTGKRWPKIFEIELIKK